MFQIEKKLFLTVKKKVSDFSKIEFFQRGSTHSFGQKKCQFFHYLFLLEIRLEIRFKNVLDRKETFFDYRKNNHSPINCIFPKGVTHAFEQKNAIFFFIFSF